MSLRGKTECRGCQSRKLFQGLDLGFSPLANNVLQAEFLESPEPFYPLILRVCEECSLGQLGEFAGESEIFRDYPYLSSTSSTWLDANSVFAEEMNSLLDLEPEDLVLELASNDGYLLKFFAASGIRVLGVEPALNVATLAAIDGVPTSPEFFTNSLALSLKEKGVSPRLIVAKNVLAHVPDIRDFLRGIATLTSDRTLIVVEAPSIVAVLKDMQFDTVYHEHFSYLSATFFEKVLPEFGLVLAGAQRVRTHGGSIRYFIQRRDAIVSLDSVKERFIAELIEEERDAGIANRSAWAEARGLIESQLKEVRTWLTSSSQRLIGYGAAAKAVTLLAASQAPRDAIAFCIDNSEAKVGRFMPGTHTPIVSHAEFFEGIWAPGDVFVVFPWNIKEEIAAKIWEMRPEAEVFVVLPAIAKLMKRPPSSE